MAKTDVEDDLDFELVTSARQLAPPPPLRREPVTLEDWKTVSGKSARFLVWELTAGDWATFMESGRTYNKDGAFKSYDTQGEDIRFVAFTARDQHGNRLWNRVEDAKAQLEPLGKATLNLLLEAANKVNSAKPASAEGNSDETTSGSQPST